MAHLAQTAEGNWDAVASTINFSLHIDLARLQRTVSGDARILDLGCGYGRIAAQLLESGFTDIVGYDTSREMIKRGAEQYPALPLNQYEGSRIPEEDASFDAVVCCALLTSALHPAQRERIVAEIFRLLRPNGVLHVAEFLRSPDWQYPASGIVSSELGMNTVHFYPEELLQLLDRFQLELATAIDALSITGKPMRAFHYFGRKPSNPRPQDDAPQAARA
jgi:ubiquinone/menaquinone biosynthesis C-methylase UbiE